MSALASILTSDLHFYLTSHARQHKQGRAVCETVFVLDPDRDLRRRPDVAFVSIERWPLDKPIPETGDWLVVPDLAVEVISPNDVFAELYKKLKDYFAHGGRQVWICEPQEKEVLVYASPDDHHTLSLGDDLDGGDIIPGFKLSLADLFRQPVTA